MTSPIIGLFAGLLVAVAAAAGGLSAAVIAVILGAVGYVVGSYVDGERDLGQILGRRDRG